MIAATSPQQIYRSNQPRVSEQTQGRNFARPSPPAWEIGRANAIRGPVVKPEDHEVAMVLRGADRDAYRVIHQARPMRNEAIDWKRNMSNEVAFVGRPSDPLWDRSLNGHHMRPSVPAWTAHPRISTDMEPSENAARRACNSNVRSYYPNVQYQQHQQQQQWHRLLETRYNEMYERNARGGTPWSASGSVIGHSSVEAAKSLMQRNDNRKRPLVSVQMNSCKIPKGLNKLDLLCSATLEIGPLHDNPMGCSCPKSKCVALYCDCFKAGRRCNPTTCSCLDCKNTIAESGPHGARTAAIRSILARNPRAFTNAGLGTPKVAPGQIACNCIRSKCLKLYCSCFQNRKPCDSKNCTCVDCYNTSENPLRKQAIDLCLEKRPDAFVTRTREPGLGCACKNNRCIRKYCDCFRSSLPCSDRCSCRQCANTDEARKQQGIQEDELEKKESIESLESRNDFVSV